MIPHYVQHEFIPNFGHYGMMEADSPLHWDRGHSAVKEYAVPAREGKALLISTPGKAAMVGNGKTGMCKMAS